MKTEVVLREVTQDDLTIFYEQQLDPVATQMAAFPARERVPFMEHWRKIMADSTNLLRTVTYRGQVAGNIVSFLGEGHREVGYWLGREYWGKGIATEALRQFLQEIRTRPLYAHVAKGNLASQRVLEKCGFRVAGEDRALAVLPGEVIEEYILILDDRDDKRSKR